jgi:GGDEF domain-containing protein
MQMVNLHYSTKAPMKSSRSNAHKICVKKIASHICQAASKTVQLTASIGICPITEKITSPDQILDRAHIACEEVRALQAKMAQAMMRVITLQN